ncbi:MAG: hypothetical protein ACREQ5_24050, partial [Candidatus Dormibacteria bacterium]
EGSRNPDPGSDGAEGAAEWRPGGERGARRPVVQRHAAPFFKKAGGAAVGLGLLIAKFKTVLLALLNVKWLLFSGKYALTAVSFLASIWFYSLLFGAKFAVAFVLLIAVHEIGHALVVRALGLRAPFIVFLPGLGAFTTWSGGMQSIAQEATIALGGPLLGALGSFACLGYGAATGEPFWFAVAYTGCFLNLLNLIPFGIFDGGRIAGAVSRGLWIVGLAAIVVAALVFRWWSPVLLIVVLLSLPRALAAWRGQLDPRYFALAPQARLAIALAYFGLIGCLLAGLVVARAAVPGTSGF